MQVTDYEKILRTLAKHNVDFIVVGGMGAVMNGAPISTLDIDVVHFRTAENVDRLLGALESLDAYYRTQPSRRLRPQASHLESPGHQLLTTRFGELDVLGEIGHGRSYEDLLSHTIAVNIDPEFSVKVLDLETLIAIKEEVGAEKDLAVLPLLRSVLEERKRQAHGG